MRLGKDISTIYNDELEAYDKLVNAEYQKHYKIKQGDDIFSNGRVHVNGIENFWGIAKMRMVEMREVAGDQFNLHLKETAWRFNHKSENIYKLLSSVLRKNTLEPKNIIKIVFSFLSIWWR